MQLKPSASNPPRLYDLPKIYKPQVPLRPIVSCIGSPTYPLAKHVAFLLSPLTGKTSTFVQNSQHFVELMNDLKLGPAEAMVSFDIKSLFTNVPVDENHFVIHQLLSDDSLNDRTTLSADQVTHLLELCLKNNYFVSQEQYYKQKDGTAMGSPVYPVVANINMEIFEDLALQTATVTPRIWKRYVDDTFCVMEKEYISTFLDHLNTLHPTIQFTMELEENGSLPFLDTLLMTRNDGGLDVAVYRKPTHINRYLQFSSHHPSGIKRSVASSLFHRAKTI